MSSTLMESFARISQDELRILVGGRVRLSAATFVDVDLVDGHTVRVEILKRRAGIGARGQTYLTCPRCRTARRVLRVIPDSPWLACGDCVHSLYAALYEHQAWTELRKTKRDARRALRTLPLEGGRS